MQVSQVNSTNPGFQALKGSNLVGEFKKHPEYAEDVFENLSKDKKVMDFCQMWDTEIFLWGKKKYYNDISGGLRITYKPVPSKNVLVNIMRAVTGFFMNSKYIECTGYGYGIDEAAEALNKAITESETLDGQVERVEKEAAEKAAKKAAKIAKREKAKADKAEAAEARRQSLARIDKIVEEMKK